MDFGRVDSVTGIDFTLPSGFVGLSGEVQPDFQVYIGLPIWANSAWHGKLYSATKKEDQGLVAYGKHFKTIELNVTHYQIPSPDTRKRWLDTTPDDFLFCAKFPQRISHDLGLIGAQAETQAFIDYLRGMDEKAGPSFLQLPPSFGPRQADRLWRYLEEWPNELPIQVEFRHPEWFSSESNWHQTCKILHEKRVGLVCSDVPGRRDVVHASVTHDSVFLRFVGHELHVTDFTRADAWIQDKLVHWRNLGLKRAFVCIHCGDNTLAPELANYWIKQCNQVLGLNIPQVFIRPQYTQGQLF